MVDVILYAPEIPQNTGSVARLCAATGVGLHLAGPLGFTIDDKHLKRAGLDYWQEVCLGVHKSLDSALAQFQGRPVYFLSKKGNTLYTELAVTPHDVYVFGPESDGLPETILRCHCDETVRIPIRDRVRSLNLSASVHIVVYHALAEMGFPGLLDGLQNAPSKYSL